MMSTMLRTYTLVLALLAGGGTATMSASALAAGSSGGAAVPASSPAPASAPAQVVPATGVATWFGPGLYGRETACGQTLTREVVGVANRSLPCGTLVQVTYAGRTLTVPVLDRGPYSHLASWDLTAGAAQALGVTTTVRIATHIVGRTANTPTLGLPAALTTSASSSGGASAG